VSLKETAQTVLRLIEAGEYVVDGQTAKFSNEQLKAWNGTRLYTPEQLALLGQGSGSSPKICVIDGTTQSIAQVMATAGEGHVALLNFASARNPGGGFLNGAKAQEEDLCRCSGLYPCLLRCMDYYDANRNQTSLLYTDYAIYSPLVPFFKIRGTGELLPRPFCVSVITAPAPNSGPFLREQPGEVELLRETFQRRWRNVFRIALDQGVKRLLLGAWGCGAFGGDPIMASQTAQEAMRTDGAGIEEIVFAIPGTGRQSQANLEAFRATFQ
jgi:uncharacterized protein (TIGR02452 family)